MKIRVSFHGFHSSFMTSHVQSLKLALNLSCQAQNLIWYRNFRKLKLIFGPNSEINYLISILRSRGVLNFQPACGKHAVQLIDRKWSISTNSKLRYNYRIIPHVSAVCTHISDNIWFELIACTSLSCVLQYLTLQNIQFHLALSTCYN